MPNIKEQIEIVRILDDMFAKEQQVKQVAETVVEQIDLIKKSILSRAFRGELGTNNQNEESAVELVKEVVEKSVEINNKPKTKRIVIPEEIKSALSSSNEEEIIRLLIKSAPKAVSVQMIMSISKKKFELMDALRSLEQKQIVIKNSLGELQLGVTTQLSIDDQIKNQTQLSYTAGTSNECLPIRLIESLNGYKKICGLNIVEKSKM